MRTVIPFVQMRTYNSSPRVPPSRKWPRRDVNPAYPAPEPGSQPLLNACPHQPTLRSSPGHLSLPPSSPPSWGTGRLGGRPTEVAASTAAHSLGYGPLVLRAVRRPASWANPSGTSFRYHSTGHQGGGWNYRTWASQPWKKRRMGFPGGSAIRNPPANAGDTGLIPWEDPICHWATKAHAPQLLSLCSRARELQLLSPLDASTEALVPVLRNKRSHHNEKPTHHNQRGALTRRN